MRAFVFVVLSILARGLSLELRGNKDKKGGEVKEGNCKKSLRAATHDCGAKNETLETCQTMTSALGNLGLDPDDINNVAVEIKNGKRIGKVCREIPSRIGMRGYLNNIVSDLFEDGEKVQKIWEKIKEISADIVEPDNTKSPKSPVDTFNRGVLGLCIKTMEDAKILVDSGKFNSTTIEQLCQQINSPYGQKFCNGLFNEYGDDINAKLNKGTEEETVCGNILNPVTQNEQ